MLLGYTVNARRLYDTSYMQVVLGGITGAIPHAFLTDKNRRFSEKYILYIFVACSGREKTLCASYLKFFSSYFIFSGELCKIDLKKMFDKNLFCIIHVIAVMLTLHLNITLINLNLVLH